MSKTVKVASTQMTNTTVITRFGEVEIDHEGCANVHPDMAKMIGEGLFGEAWRLLGKKKKKKPASTDATVPDMHAQSRADAAELEEAVAQAETRKKRTKKKKKKKKRSA